ncbi:hypothetical protein [Nitrososphaera sp.]|uniref:hypothetical protein n=1 Tax=Nitrososphaera sp. TaxID=1971748 RepID=UPI00307D3F8C
MLSPSSLLHAGSAQKPDERIDVRAREISVNLPLYGRTLTGYHLYIVYSDAAGKEFVCEGFPFYSSAGQVPSTHALFYGAPGLLTQGHCGFMRDDGPAAVYGGNGGPLQGRRHSVTVLWGKGAGEAYRCFEEETAMFNAEKVPYRMATGPNSNTFVRTILDRCGVPALKPAGAVPAPGWEISLVR